MSLTHYDCLGISNDATPEQVKARYRLLARIYHPDKYQQDTELQRYAQERMIIVNEAYKVLCQPQLRDQYNQEIGVTAMGEGNETAENSNPAEMHFQFAIELRDLIGADSSNHIIYGISQHLENCMTITNDAELKLEVKMALIALLVENHTSFSPSQIALENARQLCAEVWTQYSNHEEAEVARAYYFKAALGLGNMQEVKLSLDALVAHTHDQELKGTAFMQSAEFYRFKISNFSMALAMYEMAFQTSADPEVKAKACYEIARCYDSDLKSYSEARRWYSFCQSSFPYSNEGKDCGWRIQWIADK